MDAHINEPTVLIPICSHRYKEANVETTDYLDVLPWNLCEDRTRFLVGQEFTLNGKRIMVEAIYDGHKGYAVRNVHGDEVKWVDRYTLCDAIDKGEFKLHRLNV